MSHITSVIDRSSNDTSRDPQSLPQLSVLAAQALDIGYFKGKSGFNKALVALVASACYKRVCVKVNGVILPKVKDNTWSLSLHQGPEFYGPLTVFGVYAKDIVSAVCTITHISESGTKIQFLQPLERHGTCISFPQKYLLRSKCDTLEIVITFQQPQMEETPKQVIIEQYFTDMDTRNALGTACALPEVAKYALNNVRPTPVRNVHYFKTSTSYPRWGNSVFFHIDSSSLKMQQLLSATLHLRFYGNLPTKPIEKIGFECGGFVWHQFQASWLEATQQILRWPAPTVTTEDGDVKTYSIRLPFGFDTKMFSSVFSCTPYNRRDLGIYSHHVHIDFGAFSHEVSDEKNILREAVLEIESESLNVYEPQSCMVISRERTWQVSSDQLVLPSPNYIIHENTTTLYLKADNPETGITIKINKAILLILAAHHRIGDWFIVPFQLTLKESDELIFEFSSPVKQFTMIQVGLDTQANPHFIGQFKIIQA
jgi:hypothetical protein